MDARVLAEVIIIAVAAVTPLLGVLRYFWKLEAKLELNKIRLNRIEQFLEQKFNYGPPTGGHL